MDLMGVCESVRWSGGCFWGCGGCSGRLVIGFFKWQCKIDEWRRAGTGCHVDGDVTA